MQRCTRSHLTRGLFRLVFLPDQIRELLLPLPQLHNSTGHLLHALAQGLPLGAPAGKRSLELSVLLFACAQQQHRLLRGALTHIPLTLRRLQIMLSGLGPRFRGTELLSAAGQALCELLLGALQLHEALAERAALGLAGLQRGGQCVARR